MMDDVLHPGEVGVSKVEFEKLQSFCAHHVFERRE